VGIALLEGVQELGDGVHQALIIPGPVRAR
jgi:hypothetical protein